MKWSELFAGVSNHGRRSPETVTLNAHGVVAGAFKAVTEALVQVLPEGAEAEAIAEEVFALSDKIHKLIDENHNKVPKPAPAPEVPSSDPVDAPSAAPAQSPPAAPEVPTASPAAEVAPPA